MSAGEALRQMGALEAALSAGPLATLRAYIQLDEGKGTWATVAQVQTQIGKLTRIRRGRVDVLADRLRLKQLRLLRVHETQRKCAPARFQSRPSSTAPNTGTFVQVLPADNWDLPEPAKSELAALIEQRMGAAPAPQMRKAP